MTANMQRIMKAQALRGNDMGMNMNKTIMELNPYNKTIQTIKAKMSNEADIKTVRDLIHMLYDITILSSGMSLEDPVSFSNRMMKLINIGLGVDNDDDDDDVVENIDDIMPSGQTEEESTMEEVD